MNNITNKWALGLSTNGGKVICDELFSEYEKNGIEVMELSVDDEITASADWEKTAELAKAHGVCLRSFHLPFWPLDKYSLTSDNADFRNRTIKHLESIIDRISDIGIGIFVTHPSGEPIETEPGARARRLEYSAESLSKLADYAEHRGAVIAIEDLPRSCLGRNSDEILQILSANDKLQVAFDTNHLLTESNHDFIMKVGSKFVTTHISDYDFTDEKHVLPGEGLINWTELLHDFDTVGYNGPLVYEVGFCDTHFIRRKTPLTCRNFACNYADLIAGRKPYAPEPISTAH